MPIIEWNNSFALGNKELDEHHMHLVELFNKMFDNFINGAQHDILETVFDELIDYSIYHFAAEEQWMEVHNYPKLGQHREEHARLANRVEEIRNDFNNKRLNLYLELMQFLNNWVIIHILTSDADYNFYLKSLNCHILLNESSEVLKTLCL
jgi:hemerythrin-like metal-binding protein